jgi:hypothetical protein
MHNVHWPLRSGCVDLLDRKNEELLLNRRCPPAVLQKERMESAVTGITDL